MSGHATTPQICWTDTRHAIRMVKHCPTCGTNRRFGGFYQHWYGLTLTCCTCGETWTDGEQHPRPFARGWRKQSAKQGRALWDRGKPWRAALVDIMTELQPLD